MSNTLRLYINKLQHFDRNFKLGFKYTPINIVIVVVNKFKHPTPKLLAGDYNLLK